MRKVFLGRYMGFPVYVEIDDKMPKEVEKKMLDYFNEVVGKLQSCVEVDPVLAKICGTKCKTYYEGNPDRSS